MRPIAPITCALAGMLLCACGEERPAPAAPAADPATRFALAVSGKPLQARLAVTELELARGLMHTAPLPKDEGMLFVYRDGAARGFWMLNVPYDIDAGYFTTDGRLDEVVRLRANDTTVVNSASDKVRYVLETPAGWFAGQGLTKGARLDLDATAKALKARGFDAEEYVGEPRR